MQNSRSDRWQVLLPQIALAFLVIGVFYPITGYDFVDLDVLTQIEDYPPIRNLTWENLRQIFTTRHVTSYYPVRTLSFAIDYQLWGLDPGGFKFTNGLIHLGNALLVFWLGLRLLKPPGASEPSPGHWWTATAAAFGAALFAVHPLVVEPVTWVAGREELLMTLGALGSIHLHLTARSLQFRGGKTTRIFACHAGTVLCCAAACLSNVVAVVIPLLLVTFDLLATPKPAKRRILCSSIPLWAIAVAAIVIKKLGKGHHSEVIAEAFSAEWLMTIFKLYWINLKAVFWPCDLALSYAWVRPVGFQDAEVLLGAAAAVLTCTALWMLWRKGPLAFGLCWFCIALAPTSQIMPHYVARADRFLYLPLIGLAIVAAAALAALGRDATRRRPILVALIVATSCLLLLTWQAARQVRTWRSGIAVWENCLKVSPNNHLAHRFLADELSKVGQLNQAITHYKAALWLDFENEMALNNFARVLITCEPEHRDYDLALELAQFAGQVTKGNNPQIPRTLAMVHNARALQSTGDGNYERAIECYRQAIQADRQYALPQFNLALLLATCDNKELRRPEEAVSLARQACQLVAAPDANQMMILATAYAQAGSSDAAIRTMEEAVRAAENAGDTQHALQLRSQVQSYRNQAIPHDSTE